MSNSSPKRKRGFIWINAPISNMNEHVLMVIVLYSCSVTKHLQNQHFLCTSYFQSWSPWAHRDGNIYNTSTHSQKRRRCMFGPRWLQIGCLLLVQPSHSCDQPTDKNSKLKVKGFLTKSNNDQTTYCNISHQRSGQHNNPTDIITNVLTLHKCPYIPPALITPKTEQALLNAADFNMLTPHRCHSSTIMQHL